jgi:hypothetical protein
LSWLMVSVHVLLALLLWAYSGVTHYGRSMAEEAFSPQDSQKAKRDRKGLGSLKFRECPSEPNFLLLGPTS